MFLVESPGFKSLLAWVGNRKHNSQRRHSLFSLLEMMSCWKSGHDLPSFASALVTLCSLAQKSKSANIPLDSTVNRRSHPLKYPQKCHGSQALFSQLPRLFLLEWVTESCSDPASFPGELSRSVLCVFVCEGELFLPGHWANPAKLGSLHYSDDDKGHGLMRHHHPLTFSANLFFFFLCVALLEKQVHVFLFVNV